MLSQYQKEYFVCAKSFCSVTEKLHQNNFPSLRKRDGKGSDLEIEGIAVSRDRLRSAYFIIMMRPHTVFRECIDTYYMMG